MTRRAGHHDAARATANRISGTPAKTAKIERRVEKADDDGEGEQPADDGAAQDHEQVLADELRDEPSRGRAKREAHADLVVRSVTA